MDLDLITVVPTGAETLVDPDLEDVDHLDVALQATVDLWILGGCGGSGSGARRPKNSRSRTSYSSRGRTQG